MKRKMKLVLHWLGFVAAIVASGYVAFVAKNMALVERILLAGSTLGGLFVAMGRILPVLDKAVDELPEVAAPTEASEAPTKPVLVPRDPEKGAAEVLPFALIVAAICVAIVGMWLALMFAIPSAEAAGAKDPVGDPCPKTTFYVGWDDVGPDCRSVLDREVRVIAAANVAAAMAKCERICAPAEATAAQRKQCEP